jgi:hypothetical protein
MLLLVSLAPYIPNMFGQATLPPKFTHHLLGNSTSSFSNIFRDGGGGGQIGDKHFVVFADGIETSGGYPLDDNSNMRGFQSNSIASVDFNRNNNGPYTLREFGTNGIPNLFVPFFKDEEPSKTAIWPNSNIATLIDGHTAVAFYPVIDRTSGPDFKEIYGTGVEITIRPHGPTATRPIKALFKSDEVNYGLFSTMPGIDGFLYMFGVITNTNANGIKMARVPQTSVFDRSKYQYWNGTNWTMTVTPYDDGGKANIFSYSAQDFSGKNHGPSSGDIFFSRHYGVYMLIFQGMGIDPIVYMAYSKKLERGWSKPISLFKTPTLENGYNYNVHAYPAYDITQKIIPISWTQYCACELCLRIIFILRDFD